MSDQKTKTVWETLSALNVSEYTEKKNNMSYLSWAHAWAALKKAYPDAKFTKNLFDGLPYTMDSNGYAYVSVTVSAGGDEATEIFPVLNHSNKPIQKPTSFDVNTALQRCLTKAIGYLGLGSYIYAGEDLPLSYEEPEGTVLDAEGQPVRSGTAEIVASVFREFIPTHDTEEKLLSMYNNNKAALEFLAQNAPGAYSEVVGMFSKQRKIIQQKGKTDAK